jgi:hypothetical protein
MDQALSACGGADPVAVAGVLSVLLQNAPPAATAQALELIRPRLDDREWAQLMAAIAPLPV